MSTTRKWYYYKSKSVQAIKQRMLFGVIPLSPENITVHITVYSDNPACPVKWKFTVCIDGEDSTLKGLAFYGKCVLEKSKYRYIFDGTHVYHTFGFSSQAEMMSEILSKTGY